jgi:hypothetical protein
LVNKSSDRLHRAFLFRARITQRRDRQRGNGYRASVAARAAQSDCSFGRASERFVSERRQRVTHTGSGPTARGLRGRPPAMVVTAGTVPVTSSAGVTAPGHRGHDNGHVAGHAFHGASCETRPTARQRVARQASMATRAAQSDGSFGRASERSTSVSRAEVAWAVGLGTARETTCHGGNGGAVPVTTSAGVTAPVYRGNVAGHGFHGASHSEHGDGGSPDSAAALVAGAAAVTRAGGRDKKHQRSKRHVLDRIRARPGVDSESFLGRFPVPTRSALPALP